MRRLALGGLFVGLALACGSPEQRQAIQDRQDAEAAAREAAPALNEARLEGLRADLTDIASQAHQVPAPAACDAARVAALLQAHEGADTFANHAWLAESSWLSAVSQDRGLEDTLEPPLDLVSLETRSVFRVGSERWAQENNATWAESTRRRPLLLALVHVEQLVEPGGVWQGAAFVPGSFEPGSLTATLSLWDIQARELLCAEAVHASSSASVDLGGLIPKDGEEAVRDDFEDEVVRSLNEAAERLAPGLLVAS
jgi:hypothetical protein